MLQCEESMASHDASIRYRTATLTRDTVTVTSVR